MDMFGRLASALRSAAEDIGEVLAPTVHKPWDEFKYSWQRITHYLVDQTDDRIKVEQTDIPSQLDQMVALLVEEEEGEDDTGPCMEFLLQHNILRTAVSVGQGDFPPGMMREVLRFNTQLLTRIRQPLIPHVSVYGPMRKLIESCRVRLKRNRDKAEEEAFAQFLAAVCNKIMIDPYLADFFIELSTEADGQSSFQLLDALVELLTTEKENVFKLACDGILVCMTLPSLSTATTVAGTQTCQQLAERLMRLYAALPPQLEDSETYNHVHEWTVQYMSGWRGFAKSKLAQLPPDSQAFFEFMAWLQYCDNIIKSSRPPVAQAFVAAIQTSCLQSVVESMLTQRSEQVATTATTYVIACLTQITSTALFKGFASFLLGPFEQKDHKLRSLLITRCDDMSEELSAATLLLFYRLLASDAEDVLYPLILQHIQRAPNADDGTRVPDVPELVQTMLSLLPETLMSSADDSYRAYFVDAQEQVSRCFRSCKSWEGPGQVQLPEAARGPDRAFSPTPPPSPVLPLKPRAKAATSADAASDSMLADALVDEALGLEPSPTKAAPAPAEPQEEPQDPPAIGAMAEAAAAPDAAVVAPDAQDNAFDAVPVYVCTSPFLQVLLQRLKRLLGQPYGLNLILTASLSHLVKFPHPQLHGALFSTQSTSLLSTLQQVCSEATSKAQRVDNVKDRLLEVRAAISSSATPFSGPHAQLLHSLIVLEEFEKELCAIVLAKSNALILDY